MSLNRPIKSWLFSPTNSSSTSPEQYLRSGMSQIILYCPSGTTSTSATFYGLSDDGNYYQIHDDDGTALTATLAASTGVVLPTGLFACDKLRIVTNADDSGLSFGLSMRV